MAKIRVWLDDEKPLPAGFDVRVCTEYEAIAILQEQDVTLISLDGDLGEGHGSGFGVARFLSEMWDQDQMLDVTVECHSQNPVEAAAIKRLMTRSAERQSEK